MTRSYCNQYYNVLVDADVADVAVDVVDVADVVDDIDDIDDIDVDDDDVVEGEKRLYNLCILIEN